MIVNIYISISYFAIIDPIKNYVTDHNDARNQPRLTRCKTEVFRSSLRQNKVFAQSYMSEWIKKLHLIKHPLASTPYYKLSAKK